MSYVNILAFIKSDEIVNLQIAAVLIEEALQKGDKSELKEKEKTALLNAFFTQSIRFIKEKEVDHVKIIFELLSGELEARIKTNYEQYQILKNTILNLPDKENVDYDLTELLSKQLLKMLHWFPEDGDIYNIILIFSHFSFLRISPFLFYRYLTLHLDIAIKNGDVTGRSCESLSFFMYGVSFKHCCSFILDCFILLLEGLKDNKPPLYEMSIDDSTQNKARQLMRSVIYGIDDLEKKNLAITEKTSEIYAAFDGIKKMKSVYRKELFTWVF